jgi:hypothetical protein
VVDETVSDTATKQLAPHPAGLSRIIHRIAASTLFYLFLGPVWGVAHPPYPFLVCDHPSNPTFFCRYPPGRQPPLSLHFSSSGIVLKAMSSAVKDELAIATMSSHPCTDSVTADGFRASIAAG